MATDQPRLNLLAFPQRWNKDTRTLVTRVLLLPYGNPQKTLDAGSWPIFAGAELRLLALAVNGDDLLQSTSPIAFTAPFTASPGPAGAAAFNALIKSLPNDAVLTDQRTPVTANVSSVRKQLPTSYTSAFDFGGPRDSRTALDGMACDLNAQKPNIVTAPGKVLVWGQLLSLALRQPQLAMRMGLVHEFNFTLPAGVLDDGGWLYYTLDTNVTGNAFSNAAKIRPAALRTFAARLPALSASTRTLFAAQLFPVLPTLPPGNFDDPRAEAEIYARGFAQIVHGTQCTTVDSSTHDPAKIVPGTDAGLQIGWDDEQVTLWMNRQLDIARQRDSTSKTVAESPLGVQGYRVDVRDPSLGKAWASLSNVHGNLKLPTVTGALTAYSGELWVEPIPSRPQSDGPNTANALLPLYFANWRGTSLVVADPIVSLLRPPATPPGGTAPPMPASFLEGDLTGVPPLLYGHLYDFRVRLVDLAGGGPLLSDSEDAAAAAPVASVPFSRFVPPKSLQIVASPEQGARTDTGLTPIPAGAPRVINTLTVRRPRIGYPEALFAGVDKSFYTPAHLALECDKAIAERRAVGPADPDVNRFRVIVEARTPLHDIGDDGTHLVDGLFRTVYSSEIAFPGLPAEDQPVTLSLTYESLASIFTAAAPSGTALSIPSARDIRIRLQPMLAPRPGTTYYGNSELEGLVSSFLVRQDLASEPAAFPFQPATQLRALYLQPAANVAQKIASALDLDVQGLTLSGRTGKRVIFGLSGGLRGTVAPDASAVTFAAQTELQHQWIVALQLEVHCDWTWDGFEDKAFTLLRDGRQVGTLQWPASVSRKAVGGGASPAQRTSISVLFFDALTGESPAGSFPDVQLPLWQLIPHYRKQVDKPAAEYRIELPITTPPTQTPRLLSTGIAATEYVSDLPYTYSGPRQRFLWMEMAEEVTDSGDRYFGRVVAYGPDPLLSASILPDTIPEVTDFPALALDPEELRMLHADPSPTKAIQDRSGQNAMTELIPSPTSKRHFLLPLPEGLTAEALELFGFWTYEFRVGHVDRWSTAQARFGRALIVRGLQHPAPQLFCSVQRLAGVGAVATALHAVTVFQGTRLTSLRNGDPQTQMIFMLYAQVTQADGACGRNVLLTRANGVLDVPHSGDTAKRSRDSIVVDKTSPATAATPSAGTAQETVAVTPVTNKINLSLGHAADAIKAGIGELLHTTPGSSPTQPTSTVAAPGATASSQPALRQNLYEQVQPIASSVLVDTAASLTSSTFSPGEFSKLPVNLTPVKAAHKTDPESPQSLALFPEASIKKLLHQLGLPLESTLSVIAVEMLPGSVAYGRHGDDAALAALVRSRTDADPLGSNLGSRRILRTSPLTPVPPVCTPESHFLYPDLTPFNSAKDQTLSTSPAKS